MIPNLRILKQEATRNFLKLITGSMAAQAISFALAPLLSRLYAPEDFGLVALYLSIFSVLSVLATAKYEQAIMLPKKDTDAWVLFFLVLLLSAVVASISLIVVLVAGNRISLLLGNAELRPWLFLMPLSLLLHGLFQASLFMANRGKRFGLMARVTLGQSLTLNTARTGLGFLSVPFNGLVLGQIMAQVYATLHALLGIRRLFQGLDRSTLRTGISKLAGTYSGYPRFNMPLSLTNNLSGSLPVFMITMGFGAGTAGLYAFAYTFVFRPISLFSQASLQVVSQRIIESHHKGIAVYKPLKSLAIRLFALAVVPVALLWLWAPVLFSWLFGPDFEEAGRYLRYLCPYLLMVFVAGPLSFIPELYFRQKKAMIIDAIYLILRFIALLAGMMLNSVETALILFSAVSTLVVGYNLFWYLSLARIRPASTDGANSQDS